MLILVCGLPATGKSTIARKLAKRINATILRTDEVRKKLFKNPTYSKKEKKLVYAAIFATARKLLNKGENVIIDGTFYRKELREEVYKVAEYTGHKIEVVECLAPEDAIKGRMDRRSGRKLLSDADYGVYKKIKHKFAPIRRKHITVNTGKSVEETVNELYKKLGI